jgi:hypothetical protein
MGFTIVKLLNQSPQARTTAHYQSLLNPSSSVAPAVAITQRVVQLDAYADNLAVQALKPQVDTLQGHIDGATLAAQTLATLRALSAAVTRSIMLRRRIQNEIGVDPGHAARILIEEGFMQTVDAEITTKEQAAAAEAAEALAARNLAQPAPLPARASWAGPRRVQP